MNDEPGEYLRVGMFKALAKVPVDKPLQHGMGGEKSLVFIHSVNAVTARLMGPDLSDFILCMPIRKQNA